MSTNNKKVNGFNIANVVLWSVIAVLVVVIVVEGIVLLTKDKGGDETAKSPSSSEAADVLSGDVVATDPAGTATAEPGQTPSSGSEASTNSPSASTATATPGGSGPSNQAGEPAKIADSSSIDYSFLDGKSKEPFADAGKNADGSPNFDWYPGSVTRSEDGTVTYNWDRYASTLSILDEYSGIYRKNTDQDVLYLTFDCGYEYGYTTKILDTLKEKNVKAIFFVTGGFVNDSSNYDLLKRMYNEGHLIGNHTENHKVMPTLSNEEFVEELNSVYRKCKEILGDDFEMAYYRPPQGASCERDLALAQYLGYSTVFWSVTHADYNVDNQPQQAAAIAERKSKMHPGAVYLLHAVSSTNAAILGDFITYAESEGFTFKRIDQ